MSPPWRAETRYIAERLIAQAKAPPELVDRRQLVCGAKQTITSWIVGMSTTRVRLRRSSSYGRTNPLQILVKSMKRGRVPVVFADDGALWWGEG